MSKALLDIAAIVASLPVLIASAYLAVLAALSRRVAPPPYPDPMIKFDVVIPAHDEEAGIARTVESVLSVDYPPALRRVFVIADNCRDDTAVRALRAGARVFERNDRSAQGKGQALAFAFERTLSEGFADAVVVVDADATVSRNLLRAFSARLANGAGAIQSENLVSNPLASWRTTIVAIGFGLVHTLRSLGRERLGASAGLCGTGMCFATALLREVPYRARSVTEDLEYGIEIGTAGHRVVFAPEAWVRSPIATSASAARSQRARWEDGRRQMARRHALRLLRGGLARRDLVLVDLGLDLAVPPLSTLVAVALTGTVFSLAASWASGAMLVAAATFGASVLALLAYVARGWQLSGTGRRGLEALLHAPGFLVWRAGIAWTRQLRPQDRWVRTTREERTS